MTEYLLGFDLGTTLLKAAVFSKSDGRQVAGASLRLPVNSAPDGTREQDLRHLDRAVRRAANVLHEQMGGRWFRIAGIGLAAQGGSAIIADRQTGNALTPMQLWNDSRPQHLLAEIAARAPQGYWRRLSFNDAPGMGLARMMWLRERHPSLFADENIYVGAGEYFYFRLTGCWRQDAGSALQVGCYDARECRIAEEPLQLVGVPVSFVAPMRSGHEIHPLTPSGAKLLGLREGIPVAGPYMDHEAGFMSAGRDGAKSLRCSLGTAWVGSHTADNERALQGGAFQLVLPSPVGTGLLVLRVMMAGNTTWDWALREFAGRRRAVAFERADAIFREQLLPPEGLIMLPWLTHANTFDSHYNGAGAILGIGPHTVCADMLRAVAAGMCFEFARIIAPVRKSGGIDSVILSGGASKAWYFNELLAALFAPLPVAVTTEEMAGARGTIYAFDESAARAPVQPVSAPNDDLRRSARAGFDHYCRICNVLAAALPDCPMLHQK